MTANAHNELITTKFIAYIARLLPAITQTHDRLAGGWGHWNTHLHGASLFAQSLLQQAGANYADHRRGINHAYQIGATSRDLGEAEARLARLSEQLGIPREPSPCDCGSCYRCVGQLRKSGGEA